MKTIFLLVCMAGLVSAGVYADSWSTNLKTFKGDSEVSTSIKDTDIANYFINIESMGGDYTSVNHWVETTGGRNVSVKSTTDVGNSDNCNLDVGVKKGEAYVLNVENAVNTYVRVARRGNWSPNKTIAAIYFILRLIYEVKE